MRLNLSLREICLNVTVISRRTHASLQPFCKASFTIATIALPFVRFLHGLAICNSVGLAIRDNGVALSSAGPYANHLHLPTDNRASTSPLFTGQMPFLLPNQQRQSTEGKL